MSSGSACSGSPSVAKALASSGLSLGDVVWHWNLLAGSICPVPVGILQILTALVTARASLGGAHQSLCRPSRFFPLPRPIGIAQRQGPTGWANSCSLGCRSSHVGRKKEGTAHRQGLRPELSAFQRCGSRSIGTVGQLARNVSAGRHASSGALRKSWCQSSGSYMAGTLRRARLCFLQT